MKHSLLLLAVAALLVVAGPAYSQYIYLDVNDDGLSTSTDDVLSTSSDHVDVYLNSTHNRDGSTATCNTADGPLDFLSYEFFLTTSQGGLTWGTWTDNMGFGTGFGDFQNTTTVYHGRGTGVAVTGGLYKLGRLTFSGVQAGTKLDFLASSSLYGAGFTSFGTPCTSNGFDATYVLNDDFFDNDGTYTPTPVTPTTWGAIKNLYR